MQADLTLAVQAFLQRSLASSAATFPPNCTAALLDFESTANNGSSVGTLWFWKLFSGGSSLFGPLLLPYHSMLSGLELASLDSLGWANDLFSNSCTGHWEVSGTFCQVYPEVARISSLHLCQDSQS